MPARGARRSAPSSCATLGRIAHQKFTSPEIGKLLDDLRGWGEQQEYDSFEASLIRVAAPRLGEGAQGAGGPARRDVARRRRSRMPVWVDARKNNDFAAFLPVLRENLDLRKRYVECFDGDDEPYDVLLDDYEREMKTAEVRAHLRLPEGAPGAARQGGRRARRAGAAAERDVPDSRCRSCSSSRCVRAFGFTDDAWRLDPTVHPFAIGHGHQRHPHHDALLHRQPRRPLRDDARVRARPLRAPGRPGARAHAARARRLARACTSRRAGCGRTSSAARCRSGATSSRALQELFPDALAGYDAERWYREVNAVEPSLIRVEADEATYNLHIILRFELEQEMLADSFPLEQLPEEWNRRDVGVPRHRGAGRHATACCRTCTGRAAAIGYFPTYALGNLISAQIWERIIADLPDLDGRFEAGEFGAAPRLAARAPAPLRPQVHAGARRSSASSGRAEIDPEPYVRYLRDEARGHLRHRRERLPRSRRIPRR